jgi:hypothetical protein
MIIRNPNARTAGVIYLMLGSFAAATLWIWLFRPPGITIETLKSIPGAERLLVTLAALFLSSTAMGAYLIVCSRPPTIVLFVSVVIACVAFGWNVVAPGFWLVPAVFVFLACRATRDNFSEHRS